MKRSRRQVEKDGAKRLDGFWPCPDYTTCVGMVVHLARKTACSHFYGAAWSLTIGTVLNDLCDTGCIGIRSEKASVQSMRQKWASKCVPEQSGSSVMSVPHWPSRVEQSTMFSFLLKPSPAAKALWLTVCIKRWGTDFYKNYLFRTVYNNSVYWKEILLTAATQWAAKNITIPNYQNELSETSAFSLSNKKPWINDLSFISFFFGKTS